MDQLVSAIAQHGYSILFTFVFLEVIGLPVACRAPADHRGRRERERPCLILCTSILTALIGHALGDAMMFLRRPLYRLVAARRAVPAFAEPRILHPALG